MLKPARIPAFPRLAITLPTTMAAEDGAYPLKVDPRAKVARETAKTAFAG